MDEVRESSTTGFKAYNEERPHDAMGSLSVDGSSSLFIPKTSSLVRELTNALKVAEQHPACATAFAPRQISLSMDSLSYLEAEFVLIIE